MEAASSSHEDGQHGVNMGLRATWYVTRRKHEPRENATSTININSTVKTCTLIPVVHIYEYANRKEMVINYIWKCKWKHV